MVKIYSAEMLALVENMMNVLKMHGIECFIRNQYLSAAVGEIPPHEAWPQLWVSDEDFKRAEQVIKDAETVSPELNATIICPVCRETVEGPFAECWNCGSALD